MAPQLFITGATGYIGGDALALIVEKHPDWQITCLVRNSDKGAAIASKYAHIRLVYGDLDSVELIEEEASKADIVYHFANCDHEPSANAIVRGLGRRVNEIPGYWIHTSGSMILALETFERGCFGEQTDKVFNDWDNVADLINMPDKAAHRNVDKIVLAASTLHSNIKTAIVCPPTIYGTGRGPDNQRSMQAPNATETFLKLQKAFKISKGENIWHQVHVHDLSQLYLLLGEAAVAGGPPATWNDQGYYLAENGQFVWGDILDEIAKVAHKKELLPTNQTDSVSAANATTMTGSESFHIMVGTNSRGHSLRARRLLNWEPKERSLKDEIPDIVEIEAKRLELIKGHAQKMEELSK